MAERKHKNINDEMQKVQENSELQRKALADRERAIAGTKKPKK